MDIRVKVRSPLRKVQAEDRKLKSSLEWPIIHTGSCKSESARVEVF